MLDMLDAHTRLLSAGETMQWRTDIGGETNEHKLVITSKDHHCLCEFLNVRIGVNPEAERTVPPTGEYSKSKHVDTRFVKFWLDGPQVEPGLIHCTLNEEGEPDRERPFFDDETVLAHVTKYDSRGMTCKMLVAGEGSETSFEYIRKNYER
ncbi:hypothetical protein F5882DRAFT_379859 [Hyaloscypha sp. PMI_1271]|nr:hypothetical protein F5882DRAFT_379859 [Hyaloscypha sp. PMI_1271]